MREVTVRFLNRQEVEAMSPSTADLLRIVAAGLDAHGRRETVLPPKGHLVLDHLTNGHFNILSGYVGPIGCAGVKVIGDYVDNWRHGLPSEIGLLNLYDPATGLPVCIMDATSLTWQRTGAVTCIGALHLARPGSRVVTHIGARGTAFQTLKLLATSFPLDEIRICSHRPERRQRLAERVTREIGIACRPVDDIREAVRGADIVIEATRLETPQVLFRAEDVKPGALVVAYGWVMAVDPELPFAVEKVVVDDWPQCQQGGQLHPLIASGRLTAAGIHAEIGEIVCGKRPGRESDAERILFWHRGFAISDIVLGKAIFDRAVGEDVGTNLKLLDADEE